MAENGRGVSEIPGFVWDESRKRYFRVLNGGLAPANAGDEQSKFKSTSTNSSGADCSNSKPRMASYTMSELGRQDRLSSRDEALAVSLDMARNRGQTCREDARQRARLQWNKFTPFAPMGKGRASEDRAVPGNVDSIVRLRASEGTLFSVSHYGVLSYKNTANASRCESLDTNSLGATKRVIGFTDLDVMDRLDHRDSATALIVSTYLDLDAHCNSSNCQVFDLATGELQVTYNLPETINSAVRDSRGRVVCGSDSGYYINGAFHGLNSAVTALCPIENAEKVVFGCRNGDLFIIDTATSKVILRFRHSSCVTNILTRKGNQCVVSGVLDRLALYDLSNGQLLQLYAGYHNDSVLHHGMALSPDHTMLAVAIDNGKIQVYDVMSGTLLPSPQFELEGAKEDIVFTAIDWNSDGVFVSYQSQVYKSSLLSPTLQNRRMLPWSLSREGSATAHKALLEGVKLAIEANCEGLFE